MTRLGGVWDALNVFVLSGKPWLRRMTGCLGLVALGWVFGCSKETGPEPRSGASNHQALAPAPATQKSDVSKPAPQPASTLEMARRLAEFARQAVPMENPYYNDLNARYLQERIPLTKDPEALFQMRIQYPLELMRAGASAEAVRAFTDLNAWLEQGRPEFLNANRANLMLYQATAYLRLGEQANCLGYHNAESCLFPIQGGGIHREPEGSRLALGLLRSILERWPEDLSARWLLNLAHMTLGEYPDQVPARWLIPPESIRSEFDIGRFTDVAGRIGLNVSELSGGSVLEDFDNDGWLDLMVSAIGLHDQLRLFRNLGDGRFEERTEPAGLTGLFGGLNLVQADYNNDGFADVLVLRGGWFAQAGQHPNSLLKNNGDGTFEDVTRQAGLLSFHPTQTAVWSDFNLDGWIDLFIGNESTGRSRHRCEFYRNNRDGTFTECAEESGVAVIGYVKAVACADFDNDRWPDLYLSQLGEPNRLLRNLGRIETRAGAATPVRFEAVTNAAVEEPLFSFPAWFFDYDNDGWEDLFVAGYKVDGVGEVAAEYLGLPTPAVRSKLYRNNGQGRFVDVSTATRMNRVLLAMGSNYGDFDGDGWLDAYLGTGSPDLAMLIPNVALRNDQGRVFQDITTSAGLGHLQKGHAVSFGDIDQDGDQDVHINMGGAYTGDVYPNALFANPGRGHRWVTLKLEGVQSNRGAVGARIKLTVREKGVSRNIHRTVRSGGSFGASPLRQEIGLGLAESIEGAEVFWPATGQTQQLAGLELDRMYHVKEGEQEVRAIPFQSFQLMPER